MVLQPAQAVSAYLHDRPPEDSSRPFFRFWPGGVDRTLIPGVDRTRAETRGLRGPGGGQGIAGALLGKLGRTADVHGRRRSASRPSRLRAAAVYCGRRLRNDRATANARRNGYAAVWGTGGRQKAAGASSRTAPGEFPVTCGCSLGQVVARLSPRRPGFIRFLPFPTGLSGAVPNHPSRRNDCASQCGA
jgi:hypothetical protein